MGRKLSEIDLNEVEKLAAIGLNESQVADALGISVPTLERRKKDSEDFVSALKRGKAKGIAKVANNLFEQSKNGQVSAGIFFMKNRAGWKDKTETDINIDLTNYSTDQLLAMRNGKPVT